MGRAETRRAGRVWWVAEGLESGMVGHQHRHDFDGSRPFGGVKHSGLGRGGSHYGMDEFVEVKYLCLGGIEQPKSAPSSSPDQPGGQS